MCAGVAKSVSQTIVVRNTGPVASNMSLVDDNGTPANCNDDIDVIAGTTIGCVPPGTPQTVLLQPDDGAAGGPDQGSFNLVRNLTLTSNETNTVTARANAGGSTATATATGTVTVNPNPSISINSFACDVNALSLILTATASGGTAPFVITFGGAACPAGATCQITRGPGSYSATVTDSKGCTSPAAVRKIGLCTD